MAPIWTDLNQATRLVTEATGRVTAQRALVSNSTVVHVTAVKTLEEYVELLAVAVQHMLDVRVNVAGVRGNGRTAT
jgi:hypothetical protein